VSNPELVDLSVPSHLDDAAASLEIDLTEDEVAEPEAPYTPRAGLQGVCDDAELGRISPKLGIKPASSSPVPPPARGAHRPRQCPPGPPVMQNTERALEVGDRTPVARQARRRGR
jgi:hypothetical protein